MPVKTHIIDPRTSLAAFVSSTNAMRTAPWLVPPDDLTPTEVTQRKIYVSQMLTAAGSNDMAIDGATTPTTFTLGAEDGKVIFITEARMVLHGTNMKIDSNEVRRFGPVAAPGLTNGILLHTHQGGMEIQLWPNGVTRISDLLENDVRDRRDNIVDGVAAGTDILVLTFAFPQPIGLPAGSEDRIELDIQDDLSGFDRIDVTLYGWQEILVDD